MDKDFKPLWAIHNSVYRKYAKGIALKHFVKYSRKVLKVLRIRK